MEGSCSSSCMPLSSPPPAPVRHGGCWENRGGYDCELVHPPPSHIQTECSICLNILKDPCIVSCCGHKFCRDCIEGVRRNTCPLCNEEFSFMREQSLDRALMDFDVFCSAKPQGCQWTGKLRDLEKHLNRSYSTDNQLSGCQFVEVKCVHPQCRLSLQRQLIAAHQTDQCKKRPFSCNYCQAYVSTFEDVTHEHYPKCAKYPVPCPNGCSTPDIERQALDQHLKDECPLTVVSCPYRYAGCGETLPRRDMAQHAQDIATHFMLLGFFVQTLVQENRELRSHVVRIENEAEKKQKAMSETIQSLSIACCASNHYIQHRQMLDKKPLLGYMEKVPTSVLSTTTELELRNMCFSLLPYQFRMENFLSYKRAPVEHSPVYYTQPFGYRFRVKVFRTEYSKMLSLDAFTSIFIEILPGPFDEKLKWPFKGSISLEIVNQLSDCCHYKKTIHFDDKSYRGNKIRPDNSSGISDGLKPFIYHKELRYEHSREGQNVHYLCHGDLYVRVTGIKVD